MDIIIIAEIIGSQLSQATLSTITAAQAIGGAIDMLVVGDLTSSSLSRMQQVLGIRKIKALSAPEYAHISHEHLAHLIHAAIQAYSHVIAPSTHFGKNILPRLAALADIQAVSDVTEIIGPTHFKRPVYAGNAVAEIEDPQPRHYLTVRPAVFSPVASSGGTAELEMVSHSMTTSPRVSNYVGQVLTQSLRPDLQSAKCVVSFGRGIGSKDNVIAIEKLADKLGAAIGASRAAVDAGFAPNDYQVGQTGKIIAPELYFAIGISGAVQHLAGIKDAKTIVAINKDPEAPIFKIADFGIIGDLFQIVPELTDKIDGNIK